MQTESFAASTIPLTKRIHRGWIIEVVVGALVFLVYDWCRDHVIGTGTSALRNAKQIVAAEQFLGLYHERAVQQAFLSADWFIAFWNIYYGTIHFVVPVIALVVLYRKFPTRYVRWRNTFVFMLAISVIAFWLYPLMPPRLMPARYGFVDTAAHFFKCTCHSTPTAIRARPRYASSATCSRRCRACMSGGRPGRCSRCGRSCAAGGFECCSRSTR
jgi:hypothetical protein